MFIGRKYELNQLENLYQNNKFEMAVLYGEKKIGKTSLLSEFSRNKDSIFYIATEQNDKGALERFSELILNYFPLDKTYFDLFESWKKAFEYIWVNLEGKRLVLIIDEYQYLVKANPSISNILKEFIAEKFIKSNVLLILSGVSKNFMEDKDIGYKSPFYEAISTQIKVRSLDYFDSSKFLNSYSKEEIILAYSIVGGKPQYLKKIQSRVGLYQSILENFFNKDGYLFEEPTKILKQEIREPAIYNSIIEAIALGYNKINEISKKTGEDNKKCSKYLKTLMDINIIKRELPLGEKKVRNGLYSLCDNILKFWFAFIPSNINNIEFGIGELVFEEIFKTKINEYMERIFLDICTEYMKRRNKSKTLPFEFDDIGMWWRNNIKNNKQEEIDIIAKKNNYYIFGECKWTNQKVEIDIFYKLEEKSRLFDCDHKFFYIFSKSGFTNEFINLVLRRTDIEIININRMFDGDKL